MTPPQKRQYTIYRIGNPDMYALLDKAHCAVMLHDDDNMLETLVIAESARYENRQVSNDSERFEVYCATGFAFTLLQIGRGVHQKYLFHHPTLLPFPAPLSFREALTLAHVEITQLMSTFPFAIQSLYDMQVDLPVPRQDAAFALAKLSMTSYMLFTFDTVHVNLRDEEASE